MTGSANVRQYTAAFFSKRFQLFLKKRIPRAKSVSLDHNSIFILPTSYGLGFLVVLVLMFIGAVNYESSLSFALFFLLLSLFLLTIFHTFRNLSALEFSGRCAPRLFAGNMAELEITVEKHQNRSYDAIRLRYPGGVMRSTDLVDTSVSRLKLQVPARKRGPMQPGRVTVDTVFPLGLFRAWSLLDLDINCLVYPAPQPCDTERLLWSSQQQGQLNRQSGQDDFQGLREYASGDSLKHVAWKQYARGQGMFTKQYACDVDERIWLDWDMFPGLDTEQRLSRLCYCVLELEQQHVEYGLRLPEREVPPSRGAAHQSKVLEILALFRLHESRDVEGDFP